MTLYHRCGAPRPLPVDPFFVLIAVLALTAVWPGAVAAQTASAADAVTLKNPDPDATELFWAARQDEPAIPMPLLEKYGEPWAPDAFAAPGGPGAAPGRLPGSESAALPAPAGDAMSAASRGETIFGGAEWYTYPPPHSRYFPRFGNTYFPHSTLGKLFFSDGVFGYVCSGAAVVCSDLDLVITAGHCCAPGDGSGFFTDFRFVPACVGTNCNVGGVAPFGRWDWESVTVPTPWFTSGDFGRDVCFLKVQTNGAGQQLHQVVGSLGFAWNQTQPIHYHQTGWPAQAPFSGDRLVFEVGSTADLDGSETPNTVGVGNFMTPGSSGGAWIKDYKQGATAVNQFWNGLNSYKYTSPARPLEMYGPYSDTTVENIRSDPTVCP